MRIWVRMTTLDTQNFVAPDFGLTSSPFRAELRPVILWAQFSLGEILYGAKFYGTVSMVLIWVPSICRYTRIGKPKTSFAAGKETNTSRKRLPLMKPPQVVILQFYISPSVFQCLIRTFHEG